MGGLIPVQVPSKDDAGVPIDKAYIGYMPGNKAHTLYNVIDVVWDAKWTPATLPGVLVVNGDVYGGRQDHKNAGGGFSKYFFNPAV